MLRPELLALEAVTSVSTLTGFGRKLFGDVSTELSAIPRRKALQIAWVVSVLVLLLLTGGIMLTLTVFGAVKPGIVVAAFAWSCFFGATALVFLPPRALTAVFGTMLGTSASDVGTEGGLITSLNQGVTQVAQEIGVVVGNDPGAADPFVSGVVWMSVLIVGVLCLPAFFASTEDEGRGGDERKGPHTENGGEKVAA